MHYLRSLGSLILAAISVAAVEVPSDPNVRAALDRISAASMQGHVSFLASDLLEGRGTPSRGLDIAAEYIAAQFRRAGLEPAGGDGYFQKAPFVTFESEKDGAKLEFESGGKRIAAGPEDFSAQTTRALSFTDIAVIPLGRDGAKTVEGLKHDDVKDKAIAIRFNSGFDREAIRVYGAARRLHPALLIISGAGNRQRRGQLIAADLRDAEAPVVNVSGGEVAKALESATPDSAPKITVTIPAPKETPVTLRNVAAILRGSDPALKDSYILVTGHYDHMGMRSSGEGDRIFNGANDDASGAASVVEIASAMAGMSPRPKRSILFVALFGEELGLQGSQYYGRHPLAPLARTIAAINLEHMGRTDAPEGPQIARASFTGYDYSDVPAVFAKVGRTTGVEVYKDEKRSDAFFARSDNQALADLGIPSHTLCVAFEYPDYHGVGDEWQKLDYDNMAKVDRMVALGVITLADSDHAPAWNPEQAQAKRYLDAWNALHGEATH